MTAPELETPALFRPIEVGRMKLAHRVVHCPLTRLRADKRHVPTDLMVEYYRQRAHVPGTFFVTEAAIIAPQAGTMEHAPGIWSDEQVAAWKKIAEVIHASGCYVFLQLWALGRAARPSVLHAEDPEYEYVAPSAIGLRARPEDVPRALTKAEIKQYVGWYARGARNAIAAGFDGVEVHGGNGYLVDQFIQDVSNARTDEYGGSVENRTRFALEIMDAVVAEVGPERAAIRLSPWTTWQDMRMDDPVPTYTYLVEQLKARHPGLAYLHTTTVEAPERGRNPDDPAMIHFISKLWAPRPCITAGGYDRKKGLKVAEETGQLVGYGALFIANPDLPFRLREDIAVNQADRKTFYAPYMSPEGYLTYSFCEQFTKTYLAGAS